MNSFKFRISSRRRKFVRLVGKIRDELQGAFVEEQEARGVTKASLARALGQHKSAVTRRLNETSNMTLETLSDYAWALDREVDIRLVRIEDVLGHEPNEQAKPDVPPLEAGNAEVIVERLDRSMGQDRAAHPVTRRRPRPEKALAESA